MRTGPVWMIAKREIKTRMLTKANIISMAVMLAVIVIGALVGNYFLDRDTAAPERSVALEQSVSALQPQLELAAEQQKIELRVSTMTADDATAALAAASSAVMVETRSSIFCCSAASSSCGCRSLTLWPRATDLWGAAVSRLSLIHISEPTRRTPIS